MKKICLNSVKELLLVLDSSIRQHYVWHLHFAQLFWPVPQRALVCAAAGNELHSASPGEKKTQHVFEYTAAVFQFAKNSHLCIITCTCKHLCLNCYVTLLYCHSLSEGMDEVIIHLQTVLSPLIWRRCTIITAYQIILTAKRAAKACPETCIRERTDYDML